MAKKKPIVKVTTAPSAPGKRRRTLAPPPAPPAPPKRKPPVKEESRVRETRKAVVILRALGLVAESYPCPPLSVGVKVEWAEAGGYSFTLRRRTDIGESSAHIAATMHRFYYAAVSVQMPLVRVKPLSSTKAMTRHAKETAKLQEKWTEESLAKVAQEAE